MFFQIKVETNAFTCSRFNYKIFCISDYADTEIAQPVLLYRYRFDFAAYSSRLEISVFQPVFCFIVKDLYRRTFLKFSGEHLIFRFKFEKKS